jgi:integrase
MSLGTKKEDFGYNCTQTSEANDKQIVTSKFRITYKKTKSQKKKGKTGEVSVQILANTTRLKYRYESQVYFLTIPAKTYLHPNALEQIRLNIQRDIILKMHDNTQNKYKQWLQMQNVHSEQSAIKMPEALPPIALPLPIISLYKILIEWSKATSRTDDKPIYRYTFSMVKNWIEAGKEVTPETLPPRLTEMNYAADTFNTRKFVLNLFCSWLVKKKVIEMNPFDDVPAMKKSKAKDPRRQRLNDQEVAKILTAIKEDTFLPLNNRGYTHSHYFPIFMFLAYTGCRPSEGIGLLVKKINFKKEIIKIDAAFARTMKGSSNACRKMKSTKTTEERDLSFQNNDPLKEMLVKQCYGKKSEDFVFHSPNGLCCYDRALNDTVLKTVLKGLVIPERILYVFRHSFVSRCFQQGMDIKTVQSLSGHRDLTVLLNIYAEVSEKKVSVPTLII